MRNEGTILPNYDDVLPYFLPVEYWSRDYKVLLNIIILLLLECYCLLRHIVCIDEKCYSLVTELFFLGKIVGGINPDHSSLH